MYLLADTRIICVSRSSGYEKLCEKHAAYGNRLYVKLQIFCYYPTCHVAKIIRIVATAFLNGQYNCTTFFRLISMIHLAVKLSRKSAAECCRWESRTKEIL